MPKIIKTGPFSVDIIKTDSGKTVKGTSTDTYDKHHLVLIENKALGDWGITKEDFDNKMDQSSRAVAVFDKDKKLVAIALGVEDNMGVNEKDIERGFKAITFDRIKHNNGEVEKFGNDNSSHITVHLDNHGKIKDGYVETLSDAVSKRVSIKNAINAVNSQENFKSEHMTVFAAGSPVKKSIGV
jgi:hypothetical protein